MSWERGRWGSRVPWIASWLFRESLGIAILALLPGCFFIEIQRVTVSNPESSDTHFFNSFSVVLGILILFAIVLFGVARSIGADTQAREVLLDPLHLKEVRNNIAPFAQEAVAGKDNSALAVVSAPAAAGAADVPTTGEQAFKQGLFGLSFDGGQRCAENRRSCGLGPANRSGQGNALQGRDRGQGQYAAQGRY